MIDEKLSTSKQDIDARLCQKIGTSIRLLEDEAGTKLVDKLKHNETKVTLKLSEFDSKLHVQLKSNDNKITSRFTEMATGLSDELMYTDTKAISKTNATMHGCKTSIDMHVAKSLAGVNDTASNELDSDKIMSSILTSIDPKINEIVKTNFNLQSPTFLQSTNSKASQGLHSVNQDLTKPIEILNNNIIAVSRT